MQAIICPSAGCIDVPDTVEKGNFSRKESAMTMQRASEALTRLIRTVAILRSPGGCPWDAAQTPESLKPYLIEEAYEVLEAIDAGEPAAIREELGDLLLQVVLQARIFEEQGLFDLAAIADAITEKLRRRHPHVFGDTPCGDHQALQRQWEDIKRQEKVQRGQSTSVLGTLPAQLPALLTARKLTERASRAGFDWPEVSGAFAKVHEELAECEQALNNNDQQELANELGDLLFATVNLARFVNIDAETSLRQTIRRFIDRFEHVERSLAHRNTSFADATLEEMMELWQQAKQREKRSAPTEPDERT
jgi:MazG family protein